MYAKLFTSIYQGTLRGNSSGLLVFTNLLAHSDKNGDVDIHPRAIAEEVGLSIEIVQETLLMLESEDAESRSPEHEGRRIIRLDAHRSWGWNIVNYQKYRAIRNEEDRREQNRIAQEKFRNKQKDYSNKSKPSVSDVSPYRSRGKKQRQSLVSKDTMSGKPDVAPRKRNGNHAVAMYLDDAQDVIEYLNKATDSNFQLKNPKGGLTSNGELIIQRLRDGYTRGQLNEVVFDRCQLWAKDEKMREYLRPATLFAKSNFEKYLGVL